MATHDEQQNEDTCPATQLKWSSLLEGNNTEAPFSLSIHEAWMLQVGLENYVQTTLDLHVEGADDASYCVLRLDTAMKAAKKLRAWAQEVDRDYLATNIQDLGQVLTELKSQRERLMSLAVAEHEARLRAIADENVQSGDPSVPQDVNTAVEHSDRSDDPA